MKYELSAILHKLIELKIESLDDNAEDWEVKSAIESVFNDDDGSICYEQIEGFLKDFGLQLIK